jgi:hypothetical protein
MTPLSNKIIEKTPPKIIFSKLWRYIEIINLKVIMYLKYYKSNLKNKVINKDHRVIIKKILKKENLVYRIVLLKINLQ